MTAKDALEEIVNKNGSGILNNSDELKKKFLNYHLKYGVPADEIHKILNSPYDEIQKLISVSSTKPQNIVHKKRKKKKKIYADINQANEADKVKARAYNISGNNYYHNRDYNKAITNYNQAIRFDLK